MSGSWRRRSCREREDLGGFLGIMGSKLWVMDVEDNDEDGFSVQGLRVCLKMCSDIDREGEEFLATVFREKYFWDL